MKTFYVSALYGQGWWVGAVYIILSPRVHSLVQITRAFGVSMGKGLCSLCHVFTPCEFLHFSPDFFPITMPSPKSPDPSSPRRISSLRQSCWIPRARLRAFPVVSALVSTLFLFSHLQWTFFLGVIWAQSPLLFSMQLFQTVYSHPAFCSGSSRNSPV